MFAHRFIVSAPAESDASGTGIVYDREMQLMVDRSGTPLVLSAAARMDTGQRSQPPNERDPDVFSELNRRVVDSLKSDRVVPRLDTRQGTRGSDDEKGAAGAWEANRQRSVGAEGVPASRP